MKSFTLMETGDVMLEVKPLKMVKKLSNGSTVRIAYNGQVLLCSCGTWITIGLTTPMIHKFLKVKLMKNSLNYSYNL
jgi:hypothetical protein